MQPQYKKRRGIISSVLLQKAYTSKKLKMGYLRSIAAPKLKSSSILFVFPFFFENSNLATFLCRTWCHADTAHAVYDRSDHARKVREIGDDYSCTPLKYSPGTRFIFFLECSCVEETPLKHSVYFLGCCDEFKAQLIHCRNYSYLQS